MHSKKMNGSYLVIRKLLIPDDGVIVRPLEHRESHRTDNGFTFLIQIQVTLPDQIPNSIIRGMRPLFPLSKPIDSRGLLHHLVIKRNHSIELLQRSLFQMNHTTCKDNNYLNAYSL